MKSSAKKVELASVDDLFTTEESRQDAAREKIVEIPLTELFPFEGHPFSVRDDEAMKETVESGTGASGPVSWLAWKPCRSLSEIWTEMPPLS